LLGHATSQAVLLAGRALLAFNRMLFPCPTQLLATLGRAPELPDGFLELTDELLTSPSPEAFTHYLSALVGFTDWGIADSAVLSRFMELDEWSWFEREPELAQR
jgi:hypothetical protein